MDCLLFFRTGVKLFVITASFSDTDTCFDWVERSRPPLRRMSISRGVLLWLCKRMQEASGNEGKIFKPWRCRDMPTYIYCTQKFNKYGRYISIIAVKGQNRTVIILPENQFNKGWRRLIHKIEDFINKVSNTHGTFITEGDTRWNTIVVCVCVVGGG